MLKIPFWTPPKARSERAPARVGFSLSSASHARRLRWPAVAIATVLVIGGLVLGYQRLTAAPAPTTTSQIVRATRGSITSTISSTGTVTAAKQAKLAFSSSATITSVKVKVGDSVTKGQELATLDSTSLTLAVSQAKSALSTAEATVAKEKAGSTDQDLRAAQTSLDAAKAKLNLMLAGGRPEEIATAKASLDSARANLNKLQSPSDADLKSAEQGVASAQASLQKAEADLATLKAGPSAEDVKNAELAVDQAKNSLWSAQISRDGTCGNDPDNYRCKSANTSVASAETAVTKAQNDLEIAKAGATADEIKTAEQNVASAQAQLKSAQAQLDQLKAGGTPEELAAAQAAVTQAEQSLALKEKPYTDADILAQRQAVASAEAALAARQTPYTAADLASAQAAVDQAKAGLDLAQFNLDNSSLTAPFDGVVAAVGVNVGEAAASPAVTIVDPTSVRLDVTVDEADIAKIETGQKAVITFDSVSGKTFQGQITGVAPTATITSGVATYAVSISIEKPDGVKAGMTGNASIVQSQKENALLVPNRAVKTQGKTKVVDVLVNGQQQTRTVQVGISNDQQTEITDGLAENDQVVVSATTSANRTGASSSVMMMGGPDAGGPPPGR